ncbi:AraC family transcriptional regulator [Gallaecimonas mangrovi]|uniref:AraC family transcriptional regulator n=1 Tax=Gallaecimonas mangrovi TaxID=2291597 RepID=UPI000E20C228|nr:AraC family transcriptional regulator [Gallaecimonas mangrovi]
MSRYQAFNLLAQHNTQLHDNLELDNGIELAAWSNHFDRITQCPDHHTLSLYVADGYESYHKNGDQWHNGGGPNRACVLPRHSESSWDIRGKLSFVHLYFTDGHLRKLTEQTWDKSPFAIDLQERIFVEDKQITALYRQFLLRHQWHDHSHKLVLSSATNLLLTHLLSRYGHFDWRLPAVRGGLAPVVAKRVTEYIEQYLAEPLLLSTLAAEAGLSEYHFARMFKQSLGQAPHQYVLGRRLARAKALLAHSNASLTDIAHGCGFSSASHFSNRFKAAEGISPSAYRQA